MHLSLSFLSGWFFVLVSRFALCFHRVCCVSTVARIVQFGNGVDVIPVALVRKRFDFTLSGPGVMALNCLPVLINTAILSL